MERVDSAQPAAASRTAMMAAGGRGWHLLTHGPRAVLDDWLALPLVGAEAEVLLASLRAAFGDPTARLATWMAARSRISEDWHAASGAQQYVLLGAGLDSFAWRQPDAGRVFEVDHPATQAWKRQRLEALAVPTPDHLTWVPVDFEVESVADGLDRAGMDAGETFVSWLGVTAYLSREAIVATLRALPPCSLAVSYGLPEEAWSEAARPVSETFLGMAAQAGEPLLSLCTPNEFAAVLAEGGFAMLEEVTPGEVERRYGAPAVAIGDERVALARKAHS